MKSQCDGQFVDMSTHQNFTNQIVC